MKMGKREADSEGLEDKVYNIASGEKPGSFSSGSVRK